MIFLTPAERRAALLLTSLLLLGALSDGLADRWNTRRGEGLARIDSLAPPPPASVGSAATERVAANVPADAGPIVDLNHATARELDTLPGVGPVLAARIIEHREQAGAFREVEDLRAVRGIGPKLFARLKDRVQVSAASAPRGR